MGGVSIGVDFLGKRGKVRYCGNERNFKMRDIWGIIATFVSVAGSPEEAKKLVDEEVAKGDCTPISKQLRDHKIDCMFENIKGVPRQK